MWQAAETRGWDMSQKEADAMTKELANNGMTVVEPSEDLVSGLRAIGEEMKTDWEATANQAAKDVVAKLK
jgi:TRAP-type C4-dicarboxylate transport system substrate-binding protein